MSCNVEYKKNQLKNVLMYEFGNTANISSLLQNTRFITPKVYVHVHCTLCTIYVREEMWLSIL